MGQGRAGQGQGGAAAGQARGSGRAGQGQGRAGAGGAAAGQARGRAAEWGAKLWPIPHGQLPTLLYFGPLATVCCACLSFTRCALLHMALLSCMRLSCTWLKVQGGLGGRVAANGTYVFVHPLELEGGEVGTDGQAGDWPEVVLWRGRGTMQAGRHGENRNRPVMGQNSFHGRGGAPCMQVGKGRQAQAGDGPKVVL